jgi:hypothetical protein
MDLERLAARARGQFGIPDITAEAINCDGCLTDYDRLCGYCHECRVCTCTSARDTLNCAQRDDFGCRTLGTFIGMAAAARDNLNSLRSSLNARVH